MEGPHLIEEAARRPSGGGPSLKRVFVTGRFAGREPGLISAVERAGVEAVEVTERIMAALTDTEAPQGIAAIASCRPASLGEVKAEGLVVVLDGVQDPGNLGAIVRTADAAGASAVIILPGTCDPFMPKALRASAGSVFNLPLAFAAREETALRLREAGVRVCAASPRAELSVFDADLRPPVAIVFGNESRGLSPRMEEAAQVAVRVPILGRAESLNVAASAAVCLYEAVRQGSANGPEARSGKKPGGKRGGAA